MLQCERPSGYHFASEEREGAARKGHLHIAERRTHGLRRRRGIVQRQFGVRAVDEADRLRGLTRRCDVQHSGTWIEVADGIHAVEFTPRAAVPEAAEVEDGIDHGRSVPWLHPSDVHAVDAEDRVGNGNPGVGRISDNHISEGEGPDTLGGHDVVGVEQNGGVLIIGIGQLVEREITGLQLVVRTAQLEGSIRWDSPQSRVELVLGPVVRSGMEVATGAGLTVTANLLVPEQGFTKGNGRLLIFDEPSEVRGARNGNGLERSQAITTTGNNT